MRSFFKAANSKRMALLSIAVALTAWAQEPAIPVDQEPHHQIVFKNAFVRVIDATFPAGYVTLNHRHDVDNVAVTISTGRDSADSTARVGRAGFSKGGYSHRVTNSGPGVMRFIDVEILKTDRAGSPATQLPNHTIELENERVRIYRVKLESGESIPSHTHAAGWLEVTVAGGAGPGFNVWRGSGETGPLAVPPASAPLEMVEIEPR